MFIVKYLLNSTTWGCIMYFKGEGWMILMKNIFIVRHCQAEGQAPSAPLTAAGIEQAKQLSEFFLQWPVERIVCSPFERAIQSITPVANRRGVSLEIDDRLSERILSTENLPDWLDKLRLTYDDTD